MAQPMQLINEIFGKLTVTYGRDFLGRWEGLDLDLVKADWAEELSGLSTASMLHGLSVIDPAKPPTVLMFRNLCLQAPPPELKALPRPEASPERVAEVQAKLAQVKAHLKAQVAGRALWTE